jgi:hypothetical protein
VRSFFLLYRLYRRRRRRRRRRRGKKGEKEKEEGEGGRRRKGKGRRKDCLDYGSGKGEERLAAPPIAYLSPS